MAKVIRSKNAGPYEITLDLIFHSKDDYKLVKNSNYFTVDRIAGLYSIEPKDVISIIFFDPATALKITVRRDIPCGGAGDTDIYGAQQHGPLIDLELEL